MRRLADFDAAAQPPAADDLARLGDAARGFRGEVAGLSAEAANDSLPADELERRLLEMGFVEGAKVEILHEGLIGRDPIAVRLDDMRVALRRRDARGVLVRAAPPAGT